MEISVDSDCKLLLYADDSTILFSHKDPNVVALKLGCILDSCNKWLVDNSHCIWGKLNVNSLVQKGN